MRIGLIDVDSHHYPNLAQMKISAWHKQQGDQVEWYNPFDMGYDRVYMSKVFDSTYTDDYEHPVYCDDVVRGGTGYNIGGPCLPDEIEHIMPDYSLYGINDIAYGFASRGCPRGCPFCIVARKEGRRSVKVADVREFWDGQKGIVLMDPNLLACPEYEDILHQLADTKATVDINQGIDIRLLTEHKIDLLNAVKVKRLHFAWDLMSEENAVRRGMEAYRRYGRIKDRSKLCVYVLCGYNTTIEEDLYRIYELREHFEPYVMLYDKPYQTKELRRLQRWCNNKFIFRAVPDFKEYKKETV